MNTLYLYISLDVVAFHAGTQTAGSDVVTSGGRVMAVSSYGTTIEDALKSAYAAIENVTFEGKVFRRDIAHRCVKSPYIPSTPGNSMLTFLTTHYLKFIQQGFEIRGRCRTETHIRFGRSRRRCGKFPSREHQAICAQDASIRSRRRDRRFWRSL